MAPSFPIPILAVTADAVRDLDGREALSGLWTLFTKCKESLQDGRRLENISWRLWYRELMLTDRPPLKNSTHYSLEGELLDEKLSYSHPSSSSFSSAMSSSASSYSPPHSPALSHTSSGYRPPTPAESLNVLDPLAYAVHDPQLNKAKQRHRCLCRDST
ncbi:hypothetical protein BJ912DRAFT_854651 [Pholiota molesta]|nr:hypothetical protein BJ912DRAFT_854651 [Pholiota molesta]